MSFSNGSCSCDSASSVVSLTRPSSSAKVGSSASDIRSGTVLVNMPTIWSSSAWVRPVAWVPITMSAWRGVARQDATKPVRNTMNIGGVGGVGHLGQAPGRRGVKSDPRARAARGQAGWPGPVGGQREDSRRAVELLAPVAQLPFKLLAAHPVVLPDGVVAVARSTAAAATPAHRSVRPDRTADSSLDQDLHRTRRR